MPSNFRVTIPEATTNIFENPSFENGLTGWTQLGTWSAVTTDQFVGAGCAKCTVLDAGVGQIRVTSIPINTASYTQQAMVKRSGGGVVDGNYTRQAIGGGSAAWDSITHIQDGWYLCVRTVAQSAGTQNFGVRVLEADMLVDACQLEEKGYMTTYCDGDLIGHRDRLSTTLEPLTGYAWSGTAHASASTRHAQERSGGRVYDLLDLGVRTVLGFNGGGLVDPEHNTTRYALLPGSTYKGKGIPERIFDLLLSFKGTDLEDLHSDRQDLIDAVSPELVTPDQPFTLRYTVNDTTPKWLQIDCYYTGGMGGTSPLGRVEQAPLRLKATNPYWRRLKQEVASLTVNSPGTVTNGGKQLAYPVLVIEGEGSIDSLANSTTGQTLTFNLFVNPGERIILDLERKTFVRRVGSTYTSIMNAHLTGRLNKWWLDRGANSVTVAASASGSLVTEDGDTLLAENGDTLITSGTLAITKCQLEFYETYESVDGIQA